MWLQMSRHNKSELEVHFTNSSINTPNQYTQLGSVYGVNFHLKENEWTLFRMDIGVTVANRNRVIFVARLEQPNFIAMDDVALVGCREPPEVHNMCGENGFACQLTPELVCINKSQVCDFHYDCYDGSDEMNCGPCDFERDMCGWETSKSGAVFWLRTPAYRSSPIAGPAVDHTTMQASGHFMLLMQDGFPTLNASKPERANLTSPPLPPAGSLCKLNFFYFMNGSDIGELLLFIDHKTSMGKQESVLVSSMEPFGVNTEWRHLSVDVGRMCLHLGQGWRIRFEQRQERALSATFIVSFFSSSVSHSIKND